MNKSNNCLSVAVHRALSHIKQKDPGALLRQKWLLFSHEAQGHMIGINQGLVDCLGSMPLVPF